MVGMGDWTLQHCLVLTYALITVLSPPLSAVTPSSTLSTSNSSTSLNSATRKFFFADNHENIDEVEHSDGEYKEFSHLNNFDDSYLPFGKLDDSKASKAKMTIQQFIDKLKEIKRRKQKNTRPVKTTKKQPEKNFKLKPELKNILKQNPKPKLTQPVKINKTPNKQKKKEVKPSLKDEKVVLKKPKPSPVIKQETKSKQASIPIIGPPAVPSPAKIKPKQPKFNFPKLKGTEKKKNPILDQEEDDFFRQGNADAHNEHHVHQHDHLHAHKAFHKHKQTHEHTHAHSNDHVHNHKHTHNHVHNHIHKHNEAHEHTAEHTHTEKHHHKHLEYIDAGGWKKRNDPDAEDNFIARSDNNPTFEPFNPDSSQDKSSKRVVKLEARSSEVNSEDDVKSSVKDYLQKYIEFYKSVADPDIDVADERKDNDDDHMSMTNKKNVFLDNYLMFDDNDYNHHTSHSFYQQEAPQYNTEILPNYEKHIEQDADNAEELSFDDYMDALSDKFPDNDGIMRYHDEIMEAEFDDNGDGFLSFHDVSDDDNEYEGVDPVARGDWEPVLQDFNVAYYDMEPDWMPQVTVTIERNFDVDKDRNITTPH